VQLADVLQFLHVLTAFWFVAGLIGRDVVLARARRSGDLPRVRELLEVSGPFERLMVIPGSLAVLLFGVATMWAEHLPLWQEGTRWVTVSLLAFLTMIPLVPLVFLPRGKLFERRSEGRSRPGGSRRSSPPPSATPSSPRLAATRWRWSSSSST
jgi:uncharacterized membrane protein